jgi:serine protease Do/serine protease DegQ
VRGAAELRARLGVVPVGETVELRLEDKGEMRTVKARVAEVERTAPGGGQTIPELPGAELQEVSRGNERGVQVIDLDAGSPSLSHGLREGDVIVGVNQRRVSSIADLRKRLRASGRLALNVVRGDFLLTIQIK